MLSGSRHRIAPMLIDVGTTALVHERQAVRLDTARRNRLAVRSPRPRGSLSAMRTRAGWFLVDTGLRLASPSGARGAHCRA